MGIGWVGVPQYKKPAKNNAQPCPYFTTVEGLVYLAFKSIGAQVGESFMLTTSHLSPWKSLKVMKFQETLDLK